MGDIDDAPQRTATEDRPSSTLPTLERPLGRFARQRASAAAVGTGLLAGGVILALYSWLGAESRSVSATLAQSEHFAAVSAVLGSLVLAVIVAAWFTGRRRTIDLWNSQHRWELLASGAVVLVIVFLLGFSWSRHLPSSYSVIRAEERYFGQLPTAVGATVLVGTGAILALLLTIHMGLARTLDRRILTTAVAAGLVVSAAVGVTAVRAGDDSVNVDHLTVAAAPIAPVPSRLGSESYRLQLPPINERPESTRRKVIAAGNGFVVASVDGLRAYDGATGTPRWHYLRRPQSGHRVLSLEHGSTFATVDGSVLITRWTGGDDAILVTFDAVTGRTLWSSDDDNDFTSDYRHRATRLTDSATSTDVILETRTEITGYDVRTAERRWSAPIPSDTCKLEAGDTVVSANAVYRLIRCADSPWRIVAIDTNAGELAGIRDIRADSIPLVSLLSNTLLVDWRQPEYGDRVHILVDEPGKLMTAAVRTTGRPFAADPRGPDILLEVKDPGSQRGSTYAGAATIDSATDRRIPDMVPGFVDSSAIRLLTDEIVDLDYDSSPTLSIWDRRTLFPPITIPVASTCRPGPRGTQPTLTPVSSAVLLVCQNNEEIGGATLDIIGFR
ncbi:PQQ-binding-like beta-propeller repeat protein [Nocardia sp. NPDC060259]|uniref:outer membrane protein assembly factor BamB family protein n=1 Tax=Nocardia sp. NPDC060259 TaxID=3347088 RepID=UPI0036559E2B